jgi:hypothetical protein
MKTLLVLFLFTLGIQFGFISPIQSAVADDCPVNDCSFCKLHNGKNFKQLLADDDLNGAEVADLNNGKCHVWQEGGKVYGCRDAENGDNRCFERPRSLEGLSCVENPDLSPSMRKVSSSVTCGQIISAALNKMHCRIAAPAAGTPFQPGVTPGLSCTKNRDGYDEYNCTAVSDNCMDPISSGSEYSCPFGTSFVHKGDYSASERTGISLCHIDTGVAH